MNVSSDTEELAFYEGYSPTSTTTSTSTSTSIPINTTTLTSTPTHDTITTTTTPTPTPTLLIKRQKINKGGPKCDDVWTYYNKGQDKNDGHYSATCYYCGKTWARGKPAKLKAHLASECLPCPPEISKNWKDILATETVNYTRQKKNIIPILSKQPHITEHFGSNKPLPPFVTERIDRSLLKAWVMAGIPFEVIENPFIIDLFKHLNPGYILPSRTTLSGQLLDQEVSRTSISVERELESSNNLTLSKFIFFPS